MTATLMPLPRMRFFDATGTPLAGGLVYTYAAGTTTPQATYTDSTASVQNTNPVVLNANGEADIWISGNYKIVLQNSAGVQQWSEDNVADFHTIDNITATSTTSLSIATTTATRIFTTQADKFFSIGLPVFIVANGHITNNMYGQVSAYTGTQLTVAVSSGAGSGTYADWTISLSGPPGPTGATGGSGAGSGDMLGASNLAVGAGGVANAATARTNLGLGTAATHDTGTGAGQIPLLDGSAKLPAVDGSQLTNVVAVPTTGTTVLLGTHTASTSATLDFANCISSSYDEYIVVFKDILLATSGASLRMRTSADNGSTYVSTNSYVGQNIAFLSGGASGAPTYTGFTSTSAAIGTSTGANTWNGRMRFTNPLTASNSSFFLAELMASSTQLFQTSWGNLSAASNAIRFLASSGNITSGTIQLFGVKNT